jgi:hypothetical protein
MINAESDQSWRLLFNHLVRSQQQRLRNGDADSLGGLHVDHEFELRGLLNGEIGGLRAFQNLSTKVAARRHESA